jgi:small subunit ribosomal protein S2
MSVVSMKALLETGVHFGHRSQKWNPKMRPYIFTERNGIHIIDLQQTITAIDAVCNVVRETVVAAGTVLFLGTKRQAQETIQREAERCGMPYVNQRWLGGTLTNWRTIRERIGTLKQLEARRDGGEFDLLPKKEALQLNRKIEKLQNRLGGVREMTRLPDLLFVVDVRRERTAVKEANSLDIPVVALVDTNCDPDTVDYIIPANDDAIRAIKLLTGKMADAVLEGLAMRKETVEAEEEEIDYERFLEEEADEAYLGEATLAKLRGGELSFAAGSSTATEPEEPAEPHEEPGGSGEEAREEPGVSGAEEETEEGRGESDVAEQSEQAQETPPTGSDLTTEES